MQKTKVGAIGFSVGMMVIYFGIHLMVMIAFIFYMVLGSGGSPFELERVQQEYLSSGYPQWASIFSHSFLFFIFSGILWIKNKKEQERTGNSWVQLRSVPIFPKKVFFIMLLGSYGISVLWLMGISYFWPHSSMIQDYEDLIQKLAWNQDFSLLILSVVILAPIIEELLFRGLIYNRLRESFSKPIALFVSSAIFGIAHMNLVQGVYAFLIGITLGMIFELSGSLKYSVLGHVLINAIGMIPSFLGVEIVQIIGLLIGVGMIVPALRLHFRYWRQLQIPSHEIEERY